MLTSRYCVVTCNCVVSCRKALGSFVDDLSSAIRKNMEHKGSSTVNDRLELLLAALVAMAIYQRDTVMGRYLVPTMMMTY